MHIVFFFFENEEWNRLTPSVKSKDKSKQSEILSYYLSEIDEEFANYILDVLNKNRLDILDLSSESWAALVGSDKVEMFFNFDENNIEYKTCIKKADFKKAIVTWRDFLKAIPEVNYEIEVKI